MMNKQPEHSFPECVFGVCHCKPLAQPEQEPVALETVYETIIQWDEGGGKRSRRELARRIVSLYTSPPQRKPMMDDRWQGGLAAQRAIEAAHGITEEKNT